MKKYLSLAFLLIILISCDKKSKIEKEVEAIPVEVSVERFDKIFYETPIENFPEMRKKYKIFFPENDPDSIYINKITDPIYRELYDEVQMQYADFSPIQTDIEELLRHIKFYFPNKKTPTKVTTLITEMDYESKSIYTDSLVLISLDLYLGKDHRFYEFPQYFTQTFERSQILPDIATSFTEGVIPQFPDKSFMAQMVYFGKLHYVKSLLLPKVSEFEIIAYTKEQYEWCMANESEMWRYFIEDDLLYSTKSELTQRFIAPAPFSKFYLEIDNESPGRVGVFIGWEIVKSYMKNNNVSLEQMLLTQPKIIFEKSKYKPKK